jgi:hypothetical protein
MQGAGLRCEALALFEQIGNVIATEGLELEGIFDGASNFVGAIDLAQSHDLGKVVARAQAAILELAVIFLGRRTKSVKTQEQFRVTGCVAPLKEFLTVIGVFEVPVAIVAAGVGGD